MAVAVPYDSQMIADGKASAVGFGFEHRVLDLVEQIGETIQPLVLQNDHLGIKEHDDIKIRAVSCYDGDSERPLRLGG